VRAREIVELPLPDRARRSDYRLVLQVFFDESGHCDQPMIVFGGLVIDQRFVAAAAHKWMRTVEREGLLAISMKDAVSFHGQFADWNGNCSLSERQSRRDSMLRELVHDARREVEAFISYPTSMEKFLALPDSVRKAAKDPKYLGFSSCMLVALEQCPPGAQMQVCYDNSQECAGEVLRLYQQMRFRVPDFKNRCRSITFGEDEDFALLQLADVYTYCVREAETLGARARPIIMELMNLFEPDGHIDKTFGVGDMK
jgi:hypothetical protein